MPGSSASAALFPAAGAAGVPLPPPAEPVGGGPLLMLPEKPGVTVRSFYDLVGGRVLDVDVPALASSLCYAAAHGWILAGNCLTREWFLLEPLSGARRDLPALALCVRTPHVALSSAPTDPAGCIVALVSEKVLLLCRPGDDRWRLGRLEGYEHDPEVGDCAFCRGTLYITSGGFTRLLVLDAAAAYHGGNAEVQTVEMEMDRLPPRSSVCHQLGFLVESLGQVLLVVQAELRGRVLVCSVFRADLENRAWLPVEGLGGRALFAAKGGGSASVAVPGREGGKGTGGVTAGRLYVSHPLALLTSGAGRRREEQIGRWFWAEHVVGLRCPAVKKTPLLPHRDLGWEASYWLLPAGGLRPSSPSSASFPPPDSST